MHTYAACRGSKGVPIVIYLPDGDAITGCPTMCSLTSMGSDFTTSPAGPAEESVGWETRRSYRLFTLDGPVDELGSRRSAKMPCLCCLSAQMKASKAFGPRFSRAVRIIWFIFLFDFPSACKGKNSFQKADLKRKDNLWYSLFLK